MFLTVAILFFNISKNMLQIALLKTKKTRYSSLHLRRFQCSCFVLLTTECSCTDLRSPICDVCNSLESNSQQKFEVTVGLLVTLKTVGSRVWISARERYFPPFPVTFSVTYISVTRAAVRLVRHLVRTWNLFSLS
jgi:hypothetical protein